ncbi:MAG: hypothetical protein M0Q92_08145 [Methanoregula sp.]|jgi:hypothetical protein|nr:hypothetical protein [Methanoregula sp.]
MIRTCFVPVTILIVLLALIPAVSATIVLSDVAYTPDAPLVPGSTVHVVAQYAIIPSGSTTFSTGHSLQMETGLSDAKWSIQILLDGRNAAQQSASGSAAFVNGELLSYSTNYDVGMIVNIEGFVPAAAGSPLMVLQVEELDNSGSVVPGSVITLSQPVAGTAPAKAAVPTLTSPVIPVQTTAPRASGFGCAVGIIACCLAFLAGIRRE